MPSQGDVAPRRVVKPRSGGVLGAGAEAPQLALGAAGSSRPQNLGMRPQPRQTATGRSSAQAGDPTGIRKLGSLPLPEFRLAEYLQVFANHLQRNNLEHLLKLQIPGFEAGVGVGR